MTISVVDFFCGCGGTSAGLRDAGMNILAGIDIDELALKTYSKNFSEAKIYREDITKLSVRKITNLTKKTNEQILFSACAPCQPFSSQNKQKSDKDERRALLDTLHPFIKSCMPDYILLENVPGLQRIEEGPFTRFINFLETLGYYFDADVKNAVDFGVPQRRKRLVLIASKHGPITLPEETHGKGRIPYKTVWQAIKNYPELKAGETHSDLANHQTARISQLNIERLMLTPEGGDWRNWPEDYLLKCHKKLLASGKSAGYTDTYGRLRKRAPACTLTTKCTSISNGRFGHPTQNRALSVREAAALQTFDDDFKFEGTLGQTARQVGNAVPVLFAKALGQSIFKHKEQLQNG